MLGWDITDYGLGDFEKVGFALITLRNGNQHDPKYKKVYAEKLLMLKEGQHSPMHFHWVKSEDIIKTNSYKVLLDKNVRRKAKIAIIMFACSKKMMIKVYKHVDRWK